MNKHFTSPALARIRPLLIAGGVLICSAVAAPSQDGPCSTRTLRGDYGFKVDGQLLSGPVQGILRGLAMTTFDGKGGLTQVDFATINGVPRWSGWRPVTGSYTVNPDCTGSAELIPSDGSPALKLRLIVVKGGKEIHTVVEGNATGSVGYRVE